MRNMGPCYWQLLGPHQQYGAMGVHYKGRHSLRTGSFSRIRLGPHLVEPVALFSRSLRGSELWALRSNGSGCNAAFKAADVMKFSALPSQACCSHNAPDVEFGDCSMFLWAICDINDPLKPVPLAVQPMELGRSPAEPDRCHNACMILTKLQHGMQKLSGICLRRRALLRAGSSLPRLPETYASILQNFDDDSLRSKFATCRLFRWGMAVFSSV